MTMIERVARAIQAEAGWDNIDVGDRLRADYLAFARAAIEAMREPTEAMIKEGAYGSGEDSAGVACGAWKAMIDIALDE
jgi:hypothetical protein